MDLLNHPRIAASPGVCHGKPVIKGTRVLVANILGALAGGSTRSELLEDYPTISDDDINAALAFGKNAVEFEFVA
jgi:uncharacterized protein (DUF433 family)